MEPKTTDAGLPQARYRLTKQRVAVLRALGDGTHLCADTIHQLVRHELPDVSLGTIYRTLDILRQIGLVQAFSHDGGAARYEATFEKHHHLLCSQCNALTNVRAEGVAQIAAADAERAGFKDVDCALTIVGRCANCTARG
jgi:Fur family ferric uptake transcriptional regulator